MENDCINEFSKVKSTHCLKSTHNKKATHLSGFFFMLYIFNPKNPFQVDLDYTQTSYQKILPAKERTSFVFQQTLELCLLFYLATH